MSGFGVPESSGQQARATGEDPGSMIKNPATVSLSEQPELLLDLGFAYARASYERGSGPNAPYDPVAYQGVTPPAPGLALTAPIPGMFGGVGLALDVPYARQGSFPEEGPQRFEGIDGGVLMVQATGAISTRPLPWLYLGASLKGSYLSVTSRRRIDLGPMLFQEEAPVEDPFLEGELSIQDSSGMSGSFALGVLVLPHEQVRVGLAIHGKTSVVAKGMTELQPSLDLALRARSNIQTRMVFPPRLNLGVEWASRREKVRFALDAEWIGWQSMDRIDAWVSETHVEGTTSEANALLAGVDLALLTDQLNGGQVQETGMRNTWNARILGSVRLAPAWEVQGMVGYDRHAVPDEAVSSGNLDFDVFMLGGGVDWHVAPSWSLLLSASTFLMPAREIAPGSASALETRPGGRFEAFGQRVGLGVRFRFGMDSDRLAWGERRSRHRRTWTPREQRSPRRRR
jgi:long-subunit fatty acid transport protein